MDGIEGALDQPNKIVRAAIAATLLKYAIAN
jgi:hypothetical protein